MRSHRLFALGLFWLILSTITLGYELRRRPQIVIHWRTETEINTAGFNLYRADSSDSSFERINSELILSQGDPLTGAKYEFVDSKVDRNQSYHYQLEEIEVDGLTNQLDLIHAEAPSTQAWVVVLAEVGMLVGGVLLLVGTGRLGGRSSSPRKDR
jgi:hypothetical protein